MTEISIMSYLSGRRTPDLHPRRQTAGFCIVLQRVIPKYRLGGDYEMDFALEQPSGLVDLVEIEPSTFPLYTRSGNPRSELVHAEQQVLDWLEWLEANSRLARDDLPGMMRPVGQVIIGRASRSD